MIEFNRVEYSQQVTIKLRTPKSDVVNPIYYNNADDDDVGFSVQAYKEWVIVYTYAFERLSAKSRSKSKGKVLLLKKTTYNASEVLSIDES